MTTKDKLQELTSEQWKAIKHLDRINMEINKCRVQMFYEKHNLIPGQNFFVNGKECGNLQWSDGYTKFGFVNKSGVLTAPCRLIYGSETITQNKQ